jgi:hypothetical protein
MGRFSTGLFRLLRALILGAALLLLLALWQVGRDLPRPAVRWLERRMCRGPLCVLFDRAAIGPRHGLRLRNVRVFEKRRLGPPALTAAELRINGRPRRNRPISAWIETVYVRQLTIDELPAAATNRPGGWMAFPGPGGGLIPFTDADRPLGGWLDRPLRLEVDDMLLWGARAERVTTLCRLDGHRLRLDDLRIDLPSRNWREQLEGWLSLDLRTRRLQMHTDGVITPEAVAPLFARFDGAEALAICRRFAGYTSPLRVNGDLLQQLPATAGALPLLESRLTIEGGDLTYRGLPVRRLHVGLQWRNDGGQRQLTIAPFRVENDDGRLDGAWTRHPARRVTDLTMRSSLPFATVATAFGMEPSALPANLTFKSAPAIEVRGLLADEGAGGETAMQGRFRAGAVSLAALRFEEVASDFAVTGSNTLALGNLTARCYQGSVTGAVTLTRSPDGLTPARFAGALTVEGIDFAAASRQMGLTNDMRGVLQGNVALAGSWDAARLDLLQGAGRLSIRKGTLMRVPLFAGFTGYLARNIPGVDALLMQSDATLAFAVTNGLLTAEQLLVEDNIFSLRANATCRLHAAGQPLQGVAQARLFKQKTLAAMMARVVTFPFSKLMEFKIEGPLRNPTWTYIGLIDRLRDLTWGAGADEEDEEESRPVPAPPEQRPEKP